MNLTPEQMANVAELKMIAGVPPWPRSALSGDERQVKAARSASVSSASAAKGARCAPRSRCRDVRAIADIRRLARRRRQILKKKNQPAAKHYTGFADMLEHGGIEAIIAPHSEHADIVTACLNTARCCEKMMAKTRDGYDDRGRDAEPPHSRNRLPAQLQPGLPHGLRRRDEDRRAGRDYHTRRLGAQWQLAARPSSAIEGFRRVQVGLPDVGSSANWRLWGGGLFASSAAAR